MEKKILVNFYVNTGYVGSGIKEDIEVLIQDDWNEKRIEEEIEEYYMEWLWDHVASGWSIIEK